MIDPTVIDSWLSTVEKASKIVVLTGAGISAESGIPTFRGPEGYWSIGSQEYHPQEMATFSMFLREPHEVWKWYCYRRSVCAEADPNPGHFALVKLEELLQDRFVLITQNVDGLHFRAGNSPDRTFQIHGNLNYMRCSQECSTDIYPIPDIIPTTPVTKDFPHELTDLLRCPKCNQLTRPHVLWFDETYNEEFYRFESSLNTAMKTDVLLVVGTSGTTNLPNHVVHTVINQGGFVVDINIEANIFGNLAKTNNGVSIQGPSGKILPDLVVALDNQS